MLISLPKNKVVLSVNCSSSFSGVVHTSELSPSSLVTPFTQKTLLAWFFLFTVQKKSISYGINLTLVHYRARTCPIRIAIMESKRLISTPFVTICSITIVNLPIEYGH